MTTGVRFPVAESNEEGTTVRADKMSKKARVVTGFTNRTNVPFAVGYVENPCHI